MKIFVSSVFEWPFLDRFYCTCWIYVRSEDSDKAMHEDSWADSFVVMIYLVTK